MTSDKTIGTPNAIVGKILFDSGVTVKQAERMIDVINRTPGENAETLVAYFQYEINALELYRDENTGSGCIICYTMNSVVRYPTTGNRRCIVCGNHS